jgi:hypothetical protein
MLRFQNVLVFCTLGSFFVLTVVSGLVFGANLVDGLDRGAGLYV